ASTGRHRRRAAWYRLSPRLVQCCSGSATMSPRIIPLPFADRRRGRRGRGLVDDGLEGRVLRASGLLPLRAPEAPEQLLEQGGRLLRRLVFLDRPDDAAQRRRALRQQPLQLPPGDAEQLDVADALRG